MKKPRTTLEKEFIIYLLYLQKQYIHPISDISNYGSRLIINSNVPNVRVSNWFSPSLSPLLHSLSRI